MNSIPASYDTTRLLGKCFRGLDLILIWAVVCIFIFMVGIVSVQVLMRYSFNVSIDWADESGRLAFVWVVFLAIPLAASQGAHIGINIFVDKFSQDHQLLIHRASAALCATLCFAIAWSCIALCQDQWDELMATIDISVAYFFVAVGIGMLCTGLHMARIFVMGPSAPQLGEAE